MARKAAYETGPRTVRFRLTEDDVAALELLGDGDAYLGLRALLDGGQRAPLNRPTSPQNPARATLPPPSPNKAPQAPIQAPQAAPRPPVREPARASAPNTPRAGFYVGKR